MIILLKILFWVGFLVWLLCSLFLILVILNQEPKGGGVGGIFAQGSAVGETLGISGMQQQMRLWTRNAAVAYFVLSFCLTVSSSQLYGTAVIPEDSAPIPAATQQLDIDPDSLGTPIQGSASSESAAAPVADAGDDAVESTSEDTTTPE